MSLSDFSSPTVDLLHLTYLHRSPCLFHTSDESLPGLPPGMGKKKLVASHASELWLLSMCKDQLPVSLSASSPYPMRQSCMLFKKTCRLWMTLLFDAYRNRPTFIWLHSHITPTDLSTSSDPKCFIAEFVFYVNRSTGFGTTAFRSKKTLKWTVPDHLLFTPMQAGRACQPILDTPASQNKWNSAPPTMKPRLPQKTPQTA